MIDTIFNLTGTQIPCQNFGIFTDTGDFFFHFKNISLDRTEDKPNRHLAWDDLHNVGCHCTAWNNDHDACLDLVIRIHQALTGKVHQHTSHHPDAKDRQQGTKDLWESNSQKVTWISHSHPQLPTKESETLWSSCLWTWPQTVVYLFFFFFFRDSWSRSMNGFESWDEAL